MATLVAHDPGIKSLEWWVCTPRSKRQGDAQALSGTTTPGLSLLHVIFLLFCYLFQGCINLAEVTLSELPSPRESVLQARTSELTSGCLSSTGIIALAALFQLLTSGSTMQHCPQAASFAVALGTAARHDNGHKVSMAASLALALRSGSTLAAAGVFGAGKTRSLTFLLAWLALTTHLTGEALCGETCFCCGFWTPNWCPQKSLFFHSLKEQKVGKTSEI